MDKSALLSSSFLHWRRIPHLILLLGIIVFLWASTPPPRALATYGNLLQNSDFETGSLDPYWHKWGYPRSTVGVESCCANHTPGGTWDAYIIPDGRYVELQQSVSMIPGNKYLLEAFVSTYGMTAHVQWWANDNQPSRECGSTSAVWPTYVQISCVFTAPQASQFNVHLGGNSVQGSGQWAVTDDWSLIDITNTHYYASRRKYGTFYGVWAVIETAYPEIREQLFSYTTINILGPGTRQCGPSAMPVGAEIGWIKYQGTSCRPKFNYSYSDICWSGQNSGVQDRDWATDYSYNYMIYRLHPGLWREQVFKMNGTVIFQKDVPVVNPLFNYGTTIQAAGEVDSAHRTNSMGISGLLSLKWMDVNGAWQSWNGWDDATINNPYVSYVIDGNDFQVSGNNGNPVPPGAPCP